MVNKIINKIDDLTVRYYYCTFINPNNKKYKLIYSFFYAISNSMRKVSNN